MPTAEGAAAPPASDDATAAVAEAAASETDQVPLSPSAQQLCQDMFGKLAAFVEGDLTATCRDYALLKQLNDVAADEYVKLQESAKAVNEDVRDEALAPLLQHIENVEASVEQLSQAAADLDAYSKRLETRFKELERK